MILPVLEKKSFFSVDCYHYSLYNILERAAAALLHRIIEVEEMMA